MLRISGESKMKPEAVIKAAEKYFTEQYGLKVKQQDTECIEFEGGGGGVLVSVNAAPKKTEIDVVTTEFENPVKDFMVWLQGRKG